MTRPPIKLIPVPEPEEGKATIMHLTVPGPIIVGEGDQDYVCGICGDVLIKSVSAGQIQGGVFQCYQCKNYNLMKFTSPYA